MILSDVSKCNYYHVRECHNYHSLIFCYNCLHQEPICICMHVYCISRLLYTQLSCKTHMTVNVPSTLSYACSRLPHKALRLSSCNYNY